MQCSKVIMQRQSLNEGIVLKKDVLNLTRETLEKSLAFGTACSSSMPYKPKRNVLPKSSDSTGSTVIFITVSDNHAMNGAHQFFIHGHVIGDTCNPSVGPDRRERLLLGTSLKFFGRFGSNGTLQFISGEVCPFNLRRARYLHL